jgi:hypothetical protein
MASATGPRDEFIDLGRLKKVECKRLQEVMGGLLENVEYPKVCTAIFEDGQFVIGERDLRKLCGEAKL